MNAITKGRILIVDRDLSIRHAYRDQLSRAGFDVAEASEATDAWRQIEKDRFDVLMSDINMPKMSGLKLLRRVREHSVGLQVVLMLETPSNEVTVQAAELGVFQSLIKPIQPEILARTAALAVRLNRERTNPAALTTRRFPRGESTSFTATEAKNEFGQVLEKAIQGGIVVITKHDTPKAVLISMDEFNTLSKAPESRIDTLSAEFDSMLARMQRPGARNAMDAAFRASPKELGRAAVAAARKRG